MNHFKLTLFGLVIVTALNAQSQSRFSFGLSSSYLINNRVFTYHKSDSYTDYRNAKERYKPGFDVTATISYTIKDNLSLETGIGYSDIGYMTKEEKLIDPGFSPLTADYFSDLYLFDYKNIFIPAHLEYFTSKRLNFRISFGPSLIIPISDKVEHIMRKEFGNSSGQYESNWPNDFQNKKINMSLDLGVGIGFKMTSKINLILQPKVSCFLFPRENVWARETLYYLSMFNGQDRSTKENLYSFGVTLKLIISP